MIGFYLLSEILPANATIAVLGLGYVGLPLALEFGKRRPVIGYDIDSRRIEELKSGKDRTLGMAEEIIQANDFISFTNDSADIACCSVFIITVPTPIDRNKIPDLRPLREACKTVGLLLKNDDVVIFESTVFPGCTEDECVPVLEECSGLAYNVDFFCGYSPERINPGDKDHTLTAIKKVTSGSNPRVATLVDNLYREIIIAGTHKTESIAVAEAAKVIENTQRDLNIALVNELAIIFNKMGISTRAVLEAAESKWNFIPFRPGLVGGHCIGVDPYYLTHKSEAIGYNPQGILAGRRINDCMGEYVASQLIKFMIKRSIPIEGAKVLVLGLAFKENCSDMRNTRVIDIIVELQQYDIHVDVFDPWIDKAEAEREYGITPILEPITPTYEAIIIAVAHGEFKKMGHVHIRNFGKQGSILYDLKYVFEPHQVDLSL